MSVVVEPPSRIDRRRVGELRRRFPFGMALLLLLGLLAVNLAVQPVFGLTQQLAAFAPVALLAMASAPSILSGGGGIDISVGPVMTLVNVVLVLYLFPLTTDPMATVLAALGIGAGIGAINGVLVGLLRYQPIVATLCMFFVVSGLVLKLAPTPGSAPDNWTRGLVGDLLGVIPAAGIVIAIPLLLWVALGALPFKRALYAVGGNDVVAYANGIPVSLVRFWAYTIGGLLAGFAGIALTGLISSADASTTSAYTLAAIAAVVIGGTSLLGGVGGLFSSVIGAGCIYLIQSLLQALNASSTWSQIAYGGVLLLAVIVNGEFGRRKRGSL